MKYIISLVMCVMIIIPSISMAADTNTTVSSTVTSSNNTVSSNTIDRNAATASTPNKTLKSALELKDMGVKVVIGPVFHKSLIYLDEVIDLTFMS